MKINTIRTKKKIKENITVEVEDDTRYSEKSLSSYDVGSLAYRKTIEVKAKFPDLWRKFSVLERGKKFDENLLNKVEKRYRELAEINKKYTEETQERLKILEESYKQMVRGILYETALKVDAAIDETIKQMYEEENRKIGQ